MADGIVSCVAVTFFVIVTRSGAADENNSVRSFVESRYEHLERILRSHSDVRERNFVGVVVKASVFLGLPANNAA